MVPPDPEFLDVLLQDAERAGYAFALHALRRKIQGHRRTTDDGDDVDQLEAEAWNSALDELDGWAAQQLTSEAATKTDKP